MTSTGDRMPAATNLTPDAITHHRVRTILTDYCAAVDACAPQLVGELLAGADLEFRGTRVSGRQAIAAFYAEAFARAATVTLHLVVRLRVGAPTDDGFSYQAIYQRWQLGAAAPECVAVGRYSGEFQGADPSTATWVRHVVS